MQKLLKQLVGAYAPKNVQEQLAKMDELKREQRFLENEKHALERAILNEASHAAMHAAIEPPSR